MRRLKSGRDAPVIRPGVWRGDVAGCAMDETLPQDKWPPCANATAPLGATAPWILVAGDPVILELPVRISPRQTAPIVVYAALRPARRDAQKRITAMKLWPVQCGPPDSPNEMKGLTKSLLPGLKPRPDVEGCTTSDPKALIAAARASEAWGLPPTTSHWVRDPIKGDLEPMNALDGAFAGPPVKPAAP